MCIIRRWGNYMNNVVKAIQDKDDKKAYALFKEVRARSAASDEYF
jgi:hypothetical protein